MFVRKDLLLKVWTRSLGNARRRRAVLPSQIVGHTLPPKRIRARGRPYAYHHRRAVAFAPRMPAASAEVIAFPAGR